jgi:hypothetical protein
MLRSLFKPAHDDRKYALALEYGITIARTAMEQNVELTPELVERAETMVMGEFPNKTLHNLAGQMVPNVLSVFELDIRE